MVPHPPQPLTRDPSRLAAQDPKGNHDDDTNVVRSDVQPMGNPIGCQRCASTDLISDLPPFPPPALGFAFYSPIARDLAKGTGASPLPPLPPPHIEHKLKDKLKGARSAFFFKKTPGTRGDKGQTSSPLNQAKDTSANARAAPF